VKPVYAAALLVAVSLSACSREECPDLSSEAQQEQVYRYVVGNTIPALKDVTRNDVKFIDSSRYNADSRMWRWNFQAKGREYIALIGCDGSVELSVAKESLTRQGLVAPR